MFRQYSIQRWCRYSQDENKSLKLQKQNLNFHTYFNKFFQKEKIFTKYENEGFSKHNSNQPNHRYIFKTLPSAIMLSNLSNHLIQPQQSTDQTATIIRSKPSNQPVETQQSLKPQPSNEPKQSFNQTQQLLNQSFNQHNSNCLSNHQIQQSIN